MLVNYKLILVTLTIFLLFALLGCSDNPKNNSKVFNETVSTAHTDSDTFQVPTKFFIDIKSVLDSSFFIPDTTKIKTIEYYWRNVKTNPVFIVQNIPFYKMDTVTNPIFLFLNNHPEASQQQPINDSIIKSFIDRRTFHKVKHITGLYFRTKKKNTDLLTDGFIEEWVFENSQDAEKAEAALTTLFGKSKMYYFIYFNSIAYVCRKDNSLYTFYSRAGWEDRRMEKLFKEIIKRRTA